MGFRWRIALWRPQHLGLSSLKWYGRVPLSAHVVRHAYGFTLLELLMVVIIIGILASIALPQYLRITERSRGSEALVNLAAIRRSEMRYKADLGGGTLYVIALGSLDIDVPNAAGCATGFGSVNWCFSELGTGALNNVRANRGSTATFVDVDLDTGATCSNLPATYGVAASPC